MEISPDIIKLLVCPDCTEDVIKKDYRSLECKGCERKFKVTDNRIILMMPSKPLPSPEIYLDPEFIKVREFYREILSYSYGGFFIKWQTLNLLCKIAFVEIFYCNRNNYLCNTDLPIHSI